MASGILGSFPKVSSLTAGVSCWRSENCAKNYYASSIITTAVWNKTMKIQSEYNIVTCPQHNLKHLYKGIKGGSMYNGFQRNFFMNATNTPSKEFEPEAHVPKSIVDSIKDGMDVFNKFIRPYSAIGTILGVISTSLLTVEKMSDLSPTYFIGLLQYIVAFLCMHGYHVGLNQLADVEIDKINKPYLPLASGELSFKTGVIIVSSFAIMSLGLGLIAGSRPMLWALFISFLVGTAYSINLPFLRWKRFTILTMVYITTHLVIGIILGTFLHVKTHVLKRKMIFSRSLIFSIVIIGLYGAVISLAKDLPDIEGDKAQGIQTLAAHLGPKRVLWICVSLLEMAYGVAILLGATSPFIWSKIVTVLGHAIMALTLLYHAKFVDLESRDNMQSFYIFIFKLVSVEYFLIPFVR